MGVININPPFSKQTFAQNESSFVHAVPGYDPPLETTCFARVFNQGVSIYSKQPLPRKFSITLTRVSRWPM